MFDELKRDIGEDVENLVAQVVVFKFTLKDAKDFKPFEEKSEGITVSCLQVEHVDQIINSWKYATKDTWIWLPKMIKTGLCFGTFYKQNLVSWICVFP